MRSARTRLTRAQILSFGPFKGAEGESTGSAGGSGEGQNSNSGGAGGGGTQSSDNKGGSGGSGQSKDDLDDITDPEVLRRRLRNEREASSRLHKKAETAERERDELKTSQQESEDKARRESQTEVENLKEDINKRDQTIGNLRETVKRLTVELSFAQVKDVDWHDPEDALRLVDLSGVEFDEKGDIKDRSAVVKAAKDLAKNKPHLVKKSTSVPGSVPEGVRNGQAPVGAPPTTADRQKELSRKYGIKL